jgi:ABC-2 type transport system ATP-binding protein
MIKLEHLTKRFGDVAAVRDLTLEVPAGEFFVFLGPNGAGKTTTIKLIVGLLRPTEGRVVVCGHDMQKDYIAAKAVLSYVPDQPFLYDKLTGREFLRFIAAMHGINRTTADKIIEGLCETFELGQFLDELCGTYSHGMKQRVVISAALLHDPQAIVVDEPTVGLDPKGANTLKAVLRQRVRSGACVFMSTHTIAVAEETADRVGIIRDGRLIALGTLDEIYAAAHSDRQLEQAFLRLTEGP